MAWSAAPDGTVDFYNARVREFTGIHDGLDPSNIWHASVHPDDLECVAKSWSRSVRTGNDFEAECRLLHRAAGYRWTLCRAAPILGDDGSVLYWIGSCSDIHDRKLAEEAFKESAALTRTILQASSDITILLDGTGNVVFANKAAQKAANTDPAARSDTHWRAFIPEPVHGPVATAIDSALKGQQSRFCVKEPAGRDKSTWRDVIATPLREGRGNCRQVLLIARDVTETHLQTERIKWTASHDALTGLSNRRAFNTALDQLAGEKQKATCASVILLDIDGFKLVDDTFRHDAGDALLKVFARRLGSAVRAGDFVARLGGDEFAVILNEVAREEHVMTAAEEILAKLHRPFKHAGRTFECRASVGAALYPRDGETGEQVLKSADIALYTSKAAGRGLPVVYRPEMGAEPKQRAETIALARKLLRQGRIMAYYQPKVSLRTGQTIGFEALLRWQDSKGRLQGAQRLAAAFEDPTVACEIGEIMQRLVVADVRRWLDEGTAIGEVAINVTDAELRDGAYHERLLGRLAASRVPAGALKIEVTERVLLGNRAKTVERSLRELNAAGVKIALDDFGTGYASLAHLKLIPVDEIKIDGSFVADLHDADSAAITRALLTLGQTLGIEVVAEGVESREQAEFLRNEGCEYAQGFLFAPALPPAEAAKALARRYRKMPRKGAAASQVFPAAA
jgi:diguanylate cyclase (GGDEF)-like protein/PAS domain S-box-containing protein